MANSLDDFQAIKSDHREFMECLHEYAHLVRFDPFSELATGDRTRARKILVLLRCPPLRLSPFSIGDSLSLLHLAVRFDLREATATLLDWGVPVDMTAWPHREVGDLWHRISEGLPVDLRGEAQRGAIGLTPLHLAVLADHEAMVRYLLARGANPRRTVGLDGGPEGTWRSTTTELARAVVDQRGTASDVLALLREAESSAEDPAENRWIPDQ
jgi:hypothetical protein